MAMPKVKKIREAVGVFENMEALRKAVAELESAQFGREAISILGNKKDIEKQFGRAEVIPELAEDNPDAPRQPPIRIEEEAIGTGAIIGSGAFIGAVGTLLAAGAAVSIPAVVTAAVIGGGSGGITAKLIGDHFEEHIEKQIEKGGMVLWVHTSKPEREKIAQDILLKHGAKDVHIHETA